MSFTDRLRAAVVSAVVNAVVSLRFPSILRPSDQEPPVGRRAHPRLMQAAAQVLVVGHQLRHLGQVGLVLWVQVVAGAGQGSASLAQSTGRMGDSK